METNFINPSYREHEGSTYIEFDGKFYKGCKRCGGTGHYSFDGESSRCYNCNNTSAKLGQQFLDEAAAQKWCHEKAVRRAQAERRREAKQKMLYGQMLGYQAQLKAAAPDVFDYLMNVVLEDAEYTEDGEFIRERTDTEKNPFIRSMAEATRYVGMARLLSTNMIEAVRKVMVRTEERAAEAAAHPAPTGRVVVTGEIVSTRVVEGDYGTVFKILVKDDEGFKVWVSLPRAQSDEAYYAFMATEENPYEVGYSVWFTGSVNEPERYKGVKGRRITFTATLEPSRDDISFAFGSRPTKGAWLS